MKAASDCSAIDHVIISTDNNHIVKVVQELDLPKCSIHHRTQANAQDVSSTESVMLEFLSDTHYADGDSFVLVQATSPFTKCNHLTEALAMYKNSESDSLLSVVRSKRFFWNEDGTPQNYDPKKRPRRQDFSGMLMENGAFYISTVGNIKSAQNRLSGKVASYEMPEYTGLELDEPADWIIAEQLMLRTY